MFQQKSENARIRKERLETHARDAKLHDRKKITQEVVWKAKETHVSCCHGSKCQCHCQDVISALLRSKGI